jgi:hypothetical protein
MRMKFLNKSLLMATAAFALAACAGNAPRPATEGESLPTGDTATTTSSEDQQGQAIFVSNSLDSYRLATPEKTPQFDTAKDSGPASSVTGPQTAQESTRVVDPYTAFPDLADQVFAHANELIKAGQPDSATAYLQRFRIIKPLWATWEAKADSILNALGKERADRAKAFEPLVLEIQNMNRAQAAYSMVASTADSLIALAPGDSLTAWANAQKQTAYNNTLAKAKKEYAEIKSLADDKAQFAEAKKKASEFLLRYRDFDEVLHIQELIAHIEELAQATDAEAVKYWETNDPAQALAKADELIKAGKYADAKKLLVKLKASKLRKEANEKYKTLADTFCNEQRKATSQLFAKAQKQKDDAKKKDLLKQAIAPLDKCLSEYPDNSQKNKVVENRQFLEKELAK